MSIRFEPPNSKFINKPEPKRFNATAVNASSIEAGLANQVPGTEIYSKERPS